MLIIKKVIYALMFFQFLIVMNCNNNNMAHNKTLKNYSQDVEIITISDLSINNLTPINKDYTIVNFWATWCAPCLKELPELTQVKKKLRNVEVILISIDDVSQLNKVEKKYLEINSKDNNYLLKATDMELKEFDSSWDLSVPYTLIINNKNKIKKINYSLTQEKLLTLLK